MTVKECILLIEEKNKYDNMLILNLACCNSQLIMNEQAEENRRALLKSIENESIDDFIIDVKRYKMISERLNLKFPKKGSEIINVC